jgi:hypothetical protein
MSQQDPHTLEEAKAFKDTPYVDQLMEKCFQDLKQSALSTGKWSDTWEDGVRKICKDRISSFMFSEIIKSRHPILYKKAFDESND